MPRRNRSLTRILLEIVAEYLLAIGANLVLHLLAIALGIYYVTPIPSVEIWIAGITALIVPAYAQILRFRDP